MPDKRHQTLARLLAPCALLAACGGPTDPVTLAEAPDKEPAPSCWDTYDTDPWEVEVVREVYEADERLYQCDGICGRTGPELVTLASCDGPTPVTRPDGWEVQVFQCAGVRLVGTACE